MRILSALSLALLVTALPAVLPGATTGAVAQVTEIDSQSASSSIMNAGTSAVRVRSITKVPSVGVIRLDVPTAPLLSSDIPTRQEFKIMVQRNAAAVANLQRALAANPVTRAALAKHHVDPRQVAGVQVSSRGSLRLYIFSW